MVIERQVRSCWKCQYVGHWKTHKKSIMDRYFFLSQLVIFKKKKINLLLL